MLFNSLEFIVFLLITVLLYWMVKQSYRWIILLITSYLFYISWEPTYILLIIVSTGIDYFACLFLTSSKNQKKRNWGLGISIFMNLGLLFTFKYYNFFQGVLHDFLSYFSIQYEPNVSNLLLPVGISFYTFQTISYSIDVYRKEIQVEKHFGKFALYVSFFPQLIAGPIERAKSLLGQINQPKNYLKINQFKDGIVLFLWGLFKKVVVADNVQILADHYFNNSQFQTGGSMLFAAFLFTVQIYADFSGYSDMAIGTAKFMGFDLQTNFRTPYFSQNITEFWKRWHITLSKWLQDYVYIPLGGNRTSKFKHLRNLFITFFLAGVWHGASWNFIIWGTLHACLIVIEKLFKIDQPSKISIFKYFRISLNFFIIILTMIPVRTSDLTSMISVYEMIYAMHFSDFYSVIIEYKLNSAMIGILLLFIVDWFIAKESITAIFKKSYTVQYSWAIIIIVSILLLGDNNGDAFFYFQF